MLVVIICILSTLVIASAIQGEIISCSRCKLNSLPEVRRFLKEVRVPTVLSPFTTTLISFTYCVAGPC